jgi:hypothetical protein
MIDGLENYVKFSTGLSGLGNPVWATRAVAFDMNSENAINPDGTDRFTDPDDQPIQGLLQVALRNADGSTNYSLYVAALICGSVAAEPVNEPAKTAAVHPPAGRTAVTGLRLAVDPAPPRHCATQALPRAKQSCAMAGVAAKSMMQAVARRNIRIGFPPPPRARPV